MSIKKEVEAVAPTIKERVQSLHRHRQQQTTTVTPSVSMKTELLQPQSSIATVKTAADPSWRLQSVIIYLVFAVLVEFSLVRVFCRVAIKASNISDVSVSLATMTLVLFVS